MDDDRTPPDPADRAHVVVSVPAAPTERPGSAAAAAVTAGLKASWARLDPSAQLLAGASIGAIVITLLGLPLGAWDSAQFALIVLTASVVTLVAAWFGSSPAIRTLPVPLSALEHGAGLIAAILAVLKVVEILFDLDALAGSGGIIGLLLAIALAVATVALLVAVNRRGADPQGAVARGDTGTRLAVLGWALVLLGWAFNLSLSFWTMGQAALPIAVLTIAALTILEAPRIEAPVPVAWIGAAIAAFGAILVLAHWGDLVNLGRTEIELDPGDFLGFLGYTIGTGMIIAGGVLSGLSRWAPSQDEKDGPADTI